MRNIKIITDSCSDLSAELLAKYDIDYAKMATVLDGAESPALLEWTREDVHAFYDTMRAGKRITTTQVPVDEFNRIFTEYLEKGCDIVYIGCSSTLSGSINTGRLTAKKLLDNYPDAKISCIDSLNACYGEGMLAIKAAEMAAGGKGVDEITQEINATRKKVNQFATVHTLDYLKRAGRVSASSAFFGNLMGVKPILISDTRGMNAAFKKSRGRAKSFDDITSLLKEAIINPGEQTVYLAHADCSEEDLNKLYEKIKAEIPCKDIHTGYIGPIIGATVGPECVGVWCYGQEVTFTGEE